MQRLTRRTFLKGIGVGGALLPLLAACATPAPPAASSGATAPATASQQPLKIGVMTPLTGPSAFFGPKFKDGINLRLDQAGMKAGGRSVQVLFEDEAGDLSAASDKVKKLVEQEKVDVMVGPLDSGLMMGVGPYYRDNKKVVLSLLNHPIEVKDFAWIFTPQGPLERVTYPMGLYAYDNMSIKSATVLGADYIGGRRMVGGFEQALKDKGGTIVQEQWAPMGIQDFGPYLTNLAPADAVGVWHASSQQVFMQQYFQFGLKAPVVLAYADVLAESMLSELGDRVIGLRGAIDYTWRLDNPDNQKFVTAFESKYQRKPDVIEEGAYEAATVIVEALGKTQGDATPEKLRDAILGLKFTGPAGPVSFHESGFGIRNIYIVEVKRQDGRPVWEPIYTYNDWKPM